MNCDQCKSDLIEFAEGGLGASRRQEVDEHLETCEACHQELAGIWQMQMIATRWRDERIPSSWNARELFFQRTPWLPRLQLAGSLASILLVIVVLADVRISSADGVEVGFFRDYVDRSELTSEMVSFREDQRTEVERQLDRFNAQQIATSQLLLRTVLETSREERRDELATVFAVLDEQEDERAREMRESLRYLIASQVQDKRNIERLNQALTQVSNSDNRF